YNHHIPQRALHHKAPIAAMKEWQVERPELFTQAIVNQTEPDTYEQTRTVQQSRPATQRP
ncbi:IS481 family transposase, partial [Cobetia sp. Dlab-2-AX]|nr:IS481 family transposase [Cobetia sp. Dlab-2-AX]MCO7237237.1 IS481 family transposase [Cobetia sp. Dlab-2-U]